MSVLHQLWDWQHYHFVESVGELGWRPAGCALVLVADEGKRYSRILDHPLQVFVSIVLTYNEILSLSDPRIKIYPLFGPPFGPPWGLFGVVAVYIYFVKWLGPRLMRDRKPFDLRTVMILYNVFQVLLSGFTFYEVRICAEFC